MNVVGVAQPIEADGWRLCARPDCGAHFKPDVSTRFYCSTPCAVIVFGRRRGLPVNGTVPLTPRRHAQRQLRRRIDQGRLASIRHELITLLAARGALTPLG
jgi:hypothetical protein